MTILGTYNPTLLDFAKRTDPDGTIAAVAEILHEQNEILQDMSWQMGNLPTGHRSTVRTGIPAPTWVSLYGFVQPSKSTTAQVTDNCGIMEAYSEIDVRLAQLNGNEAAWRLSEDAAIIEGMNQEISNTLFYGNEGTEPDAFTGLAPRFNDLSAENADNILDAGGTGTDNGSIWLTVWSPSTLFGITPKGSTAGLQVTDKGIQTVTDATNVGAGRMEAYVTHYRWDAGLALRDWRYVVRICNIDKSLLVRDFTSGTKTFSTGADLPDLMFQAMRLVPNLSVGRPVFYMSRDMASWVARQKAALGLESYAMAETVRGDMRWTETFNGIPVRRCDALSADEARVV